MSQTVLLAGATGTLGHRIAVHLTRLPDVALRVLVRPGAAQDPAKRARIEELRDAGAQAVEGSLGDRGSLDAAVHGADVVVSAVQGGAETIVTGQLNLASAAEAAGVRRFVPSDYALDFFHAPLGAPMFDLRRQLAVRLGEVDLEVLHVLNGAFMDMMLDPRTAGVVDLDQRTGRYWGEGTDLFDLTLIEDVAAFTARLAADPTAGAGTYAVSGARTSYLGVIDAVEKVLGEPFRREQRGSRDDLVAVVEAAANPWQAVSAWYNLAMISTPPLREANTRYPDLRPTSLDSYLRQVLQGGAA